METLQKEYIFKNFQQAIDFVNQVAKVAESRNHHPDISIQYNRVTLTYYTHTTRSVTEKDIRLAAEIDELNESRTKDLA